MTHKTATTKTLVAGLLAAVLSAGALVGCGGGQGALQDDAPASDEPEEVVEVVDLTEGDSSAEGTPATQDGAEDTEGTADGVLTLTSPEGTVETGEFTFDIPAYWAGKVSCDITTDEAGNPQAIVYVQGSQQAELATLTLLPGDEADVGGDIGSHLAGSTSSGNGTHVEVWTSNWPWLAAMQAAGEGDAGQGIDDATLAQLVDLSTGGAVTYEDCVEQGAEAVGWAEYEYTSTALASTVAFG